MPAVTGVASISKSRKTGGQFVVEFEGGRRAGAAQEHVTARDRHDRRRGQAAERCAVRGRVTESGSKPCERLAVHVFMKQREAMKVQRRIIVGPWHRGD